MKKQFSKFLGGATPPRTTPVRTLDFGLGTHLVYLEVVFFYKEGRVWNWMFFFSENITSDNLQKHLCKKCWAWSMFCLGRQHNLRCNFCLSEIVWCSNSKNTVWFFTWNTKLQSLEVWFTFKDKIRPCQKFVIFFQSSDKSRSITPPTSVPYACRLSCLLSVFVKKSFG